MEYLKEILNITIFNNSIIDYLWFVGIILLSVIFKKIISKRLGKLVYKLFSRVLKDDQVEQFLNLMLRPIEILIILLAILFAYNTLNYPDLSKDAQTIKDSIDIVFQVLVIIIFIWIILRVIDFLTSILQERAEKTESTTDDQIVQFAKEAAKLITILFGFLFILGAVFHLNIGSLVAGLGIGGLAVALAAQDSLENLIASFVIFFDKPFQVGDFIKIGETYGIVEKIGFRSTRIRTLEKSYLTVPNKSLINRELDNLSLRTFRRAKFQIGLTYHTSVDQIKAIVDDIQKYIDGHKITNQDGLVRFEEFGDSSLNIMVLFFVATQNWGEYLKVKEDINFKIMEIVKKHGSGFAFPTRTIHIVK